MGMIFFYILKYLFPYLINPLEVGKEKNYNLSY